MAQKQIIFLILKVIRTKNRREKMIPITEIITYYFLFMLMYVAGSNNAEEIKSFDSELYNKLGDTARIQCPVHGIGRRNISITSIRWTKLPKLAFIAHYYREDGSEKSVNERYHIDNTAITTLYINNTKFKDEGTYRCSVRALNPRVTLQNVRLVLYEGYSLALSEKGNNESNPASIHVNVGSTISILCAANVTRPLHHLAWNISSKIDALDNGRIQQRLSSEKHFNKHIITRELYIERTYLSDSGFYTCLGYYSNTQEEKSNRSVLLIVQNTTATDMDGSYPKPKKGMITEKIIAVTVVLTLSTILFVIVCVVAKKKACSNVGSPATGTENKYKSPHWGKSAHTEDDESSPSVIWGTVQPNNTIEQSIGDSETPKEFPPNKSILPSDTLEFDYCLLRFYDNCFLGQGEFGFVRKAVTPYIQGEHGDIEVAVKCLKEDASYEDKDNFLRELEIMKLLRSSHPNILKLLGYCTSSDPICIVVELATHGSLQRYLHENRCLGSYQNIHPQSRDLTPSDLLHYAWQIAKGMSFIDSKMCIHRDLASRNVLLCENKCCKISDFGFARDVSASGVYIFTAKGRLPIRWMAIESLIASISTIKSDVWSYGVVLWELVTLGSTPYAQFGPRWVIQKLRTGYRLPKPRHCSDELYQIMSQCWLQDAESRPSFSELCKIISEIANDANKEYLGMKDFDDHIYVNIAEEEWPSGESF